jgi:hypothetical protein
MFYLAALEQVQNAVSNRLAATLNTLAVLCL